MEPIKFPESNATLTGGGSDKFAEPVEDLPVFRGHGQVVSCWRLSLRERLAVLLYGNVWFYSMGTSHAPIWLDAKKSAFIQLGEPK